MVPAKRPAAPGVVSVSGLLTEGVRRDTMASALATAAGQQSGLAFSNPACNQKWHFQHIPKVSNSPAGEGPLFW